jgi:ABC-type uncharacterized transport system substrate-binding protein
MRVLVETAFWLALALAISLIVIVPLQRLAPHRSLPERFESLPLAFVLFLVISPVGAAIITGGRRISSACARRHINRWDGSDPVLIGLVASLNRPMGTLTGVAVLNTGVVAKRLHLLHEFVSTSTSIGVLVNSTNPVFAEAEISEIQAGARVLGLRLLVLNASSQREIEEAFTTMVQERVGALIVSADSYFIAQPDRLVTLAARYAVPTIYAYREFTAAGGLMSYGPNLLDAYRQVGAYTGRILKGDKPADLPVQQVTRIELVINLKAAKALGITFPLPQLGRADEVIE